MFPYGTLNKNNRWVKLANEIPWDKIEVLYAEMIVNNGFPAKNIRIALGCIIIKQTLNCSDEDTFNQGVPRLNRGWVTNKKGLYHN